MNNKVLIIAGMHRSGTSLIAQWLHQCGINLGDDLMGAGRGNIKGHFEDLDFLNLHEEILTFNNLCSTGLYGIKPLSMSPEQKTEIKSLLEQKNSKRTYWGWKEPRTTLFINEYENLLSDKAIYLIAYRKIEDVVDSLLRRRIKRELQLRKKLGRIERFKILFLKKKISNQIEKEHKEEYIKTWIAYNEKIISLISNINQQRFFITRYEDLNNNSSALFNWLLNKGFNIKKIPFNNVFDVNLMKKSTSSKNIPREYLEKALNIENYFFRVHE